MKNFEYKFKYNPILREKILKDKYLLTPQEREVLNLILKGFNCKQIASYIPTSERTVQRRRKSIYEKTLQYM